MNNFMHCEICDLQAFNFTEGIICSLTNKKADFKRKCSKIKLDNKLKKKIIEVNTEFEDSKYVKKLAIGNMILYGLIGLGVLFICYYLMTILNRVALFHTVTIMIFSIGIGIIGIGTLNYSMRKRNTITPKKFSLDKLTELYNVRYEFSSEASTDIMGIKETKIKLRINGEKIEKVSRF